MRTTSDSTGPVFRMQIGDNQSMSRNKITHYNQEVYTSPERSVLNCESSGNGYDFYSFLDRFMWPRNENASLNIIF